MGTASMNNTGYRRRTFHTSDTHFGHANIINLCNRPFKDVQHMNEILVQNWNETVGVDDMVIHHGDVALGPIEESLSYIGRLNGIKIQIQGNHDRNFPGAKRSRGLEPSEWDDKYREAGFDDVWPATGVSWPLGGLSGLPVNLSHFPYDGDSHGEDRWTDFRIPDTGRVLIHGHTHSSGNPVSRSTKGSLQIHVGVDAWDFRPVPEEEVIRLIQENL